MTPPPSEHRNPAQLFIKCAVAAIRVCYFADLFISFFSFSQLIHSERSLLVQRFYKTTDILAGSTKKTTTHQPLNYLGSLIPSQERNPEKGPSLD